MLELPTPAALVLLGRAFALFSLKIGGSSSLDSLGDDRRTDEAPEIGVFAGEVGRGQTITSR